MRMVFQTNQLSLRGTEIAIYDYAHYNEEFFNNESYVVVKKNHHWPSHQTIIDKFKNRFGDRIYWYDDLNDMNRWINEKNIDIFYSLKGGENDGILAKNIKNVIHVVFRNNDVHGDVYVYISEWLSNVMSGGKTPFVPHMVDFPKVDGDFRKELNIPQDAIVFGRTGGPESFDIQFVKNAIINTVSKRKDIYFLFVNTDRFYSENPNIIHLPFVSTIENRGKFVNTCDAMLHARIGGETFGLACAEFSAYNKPVVTYKNSLDANHVLVLKEKGIYYTDYNEVHDILNNFSSYKKFDNYDMYSEQFSPEKVMTKFKEVFL